MYDFQRITFGQSCGRVLSLPHDHAIALDGHPALAHSELYEQLGHG